MTIFGATMKHNHICGQKLDTLKCKMLWYFGRKQLVIREYEDMPVLNPNDNQGIRYVLLTVISRSENIRKYKKAKQLIVIYDEMTTVAYSKLLLEYASK